MASPTEQLQTFAQRVYLVIKNRYFDDLTSADGKVFLQQVVDWTNMFIDELEAEVDPMGQLVNWKWSRDLGHTLGTVVEGAASISKPAEISDLIAGENRYVQILQGSSRVANFAVVEPDQISNKADRVTEDMCALVGETIVFSRAFKDTEANGTIIGDVMLPTPRLAFNPTTGLATNVKALTLITPQQLLLLGVAKSATLPDIVQGGLSPSYLQRYNDLLGNAIARNMASSRSDVTGREDLGSISGVGF